MRGAVFENCHLDRKIAVTRLLETRLATTTLASSTLVARVDLAREIYLILTYVHVCTKYAYKLVLLL